MNTTAPRLEAAIKEHLAPELRADGFLGSGRTYRRALNGWLQVVNVQGSRYGGSFAINLAVHPLAIPDLRGNDPDPKKITEELCEFRRRLSETEGRSDTWWKHDNTAESMSAAMRAAAATYIQFGRPLLGKVTAESADLNTACAENLASHSFNFGGFGSTETRMALALARLRESQGKTKEASEFAEYGLSTAGSATIIRNELQSVVARNAT
jgi:Domain of unknown function (DUF4304)